ncbi:MAG: 50S ribosomal protein L7/L12 [Candidatus Sungbacteria bacterium]|uniref:Large ribosomal subunit protein bL12 n=1 Tax=Candidatus Sungiibacteriota bacterium TaxID=2750080 RepID=A0A932YXD6_9BACT|nr:50S ribosomal protein L7/L12 [Candidatus Sungbacteria bacterium]
MDKAKILESIEKMSVLELSELVKALEEKFGVSAVPLTAGPMAGPAAGGAGGEEGGVKEEKTSFTVELKDGGSQKIQVIKVLREITQLGLKEAKDLVDAAPKIIKEGVDKATAEEMRKKLEEAGAKVELK